MSIIRIAAAFEIARRLSKEALSNEEEKTGRTIKEKAARMPEIREAKWN